MKRKVLFSCLLVLVSVWNLIVSADIDFRKYTYDSILAGYRCVPNETTFEADDIFDHMSCGKLCYFNKTCLSVFYIPESNKCIGCRHKYKSVTESHEKLNGSRYFRPKVAQTVTRECFDIGFAEEYRGITHNKTRGGIPCQRWDSEEPHKPIYYVTEDNFPEKSFKDAENYCREADGHTYEPWCYTTDPKVRWEFCDVPKCSSTDCYKSGYAFRYRGYKNVTKDNLECQRWDQQPSYTQTFMYPDEYPDVSFSASNNYCRDPDDRGEPWCYTAGSKLWDFCQPWCFTPGSEEWDYCHVEMCPLDYCYNVSWEYQGQLSRAESGAECQRWDSNYPYEHQYGNMNSTFPDDSVSAAGHYCRDPSMTGRLWCYTTDPEEEWGWCSIGKCN